MSTRISFLFLPKSRLSKQIARFPLLKAFLDLWNQSQGAFTQKRTHQLGLSIALGLLTCLGRRTLTRSLCARAMQFSDWSFEYRFFSKDQWSLLEMQVQLLTHCTQYLQEGLPLVIALDDTSCPKTGKKIQAAANYFDPKSPPYAPSFHKALRFLTFSVLIKPYGSIGPARGIPFAWTLAPALAKPKKRAPKEIHEQYRTQKKNWTLSTQAMEQIHLIRASMDTIPALKDRLLVIVADSSYTNASVIPLLPERTILVGRTRKNLALFEPAQPDSTKKRGRKRRYGKALPTPEQIRQDKTYPWQTCQIFAAGDWHELRYKNVGPVLWKSMGFEKPLRLIVIEPLRYRPRKGAKLLYRDPAYLLVSDLGYPVHQALQDYFHRWQIEVNHKEAKDVLGIGDAQVRNPRSVSRQISFHVLVYSWLLLASLKAYGPERGKVYAPLPKWRKVLPSRPSILDLVTQFRMELWSFEKSCENQGGFKATSLDAFDLKFTEKEGDLVFHPPPDILSSAIYSSIIYAYA
jgi:hypothetical protein